MSAVKTMKIYTTFNAQTVKLIRQGALGIVPTDTIYGIVGTAFNPKTIAKIYKIRKRNLKKPMIVLISSLRDLELFNIKIERKTKKNLKKYWPAPVSIILPCPHKKFSYLHRGTKTLAFRLPNQRRLRYWLNKTGPVVAPSANIEGRPPAQTIQQAQKYFKQQIDFYIDAGTIIKKPSRVIQINKDSSTAKRI